MQFTNTLAADMPLSSFLQTPTMCILLQVLARIPYMGRCRTDACETAIFMQYDFSNYCFPNVDEKEYIWPEDYITIRAKVKYVILNHMYVVKYAVKLFIVWSDKQKS